MGKRSSSISGDVWTLIGLAFSRLFWPLFYTIVYAISSSLLVILFFCILQEKINNWGKSLWTRLNY